MPLTSEQKRRRKVYKELKNMPLNNLEDYKKYNEKCRTMGVPVKPAPSEMHEQVKVKFLRRDGMVHPIKLKFRNGEIDFEKKVEHGKVYELPKQAVRHYQNLGIPQYKKVSNPETGESQTVYSHKDPRFAFQVVLDD